MSQSDENPEIAGGTDGTTIGNVSDSLKVNVTASALPSGAATSANQSTEITSLQLIDDVPTAMNGAFSKASPIAGQLDDTSTTSATEDNCAPVRISSHRSLHVQLRTDGVETGTSSNPLYVSATLEGNLSTNVIYKSVTLLNGSAKEMNVNGSSVNVSYDFTPASGETWYVESLSIYIHSIGTPDVFEFGDITALTNGLDILIRSNGTEYTIVNLKNNMDIMRFLDFFGFSPSSTSQWLNDADLYSGSTNFQLPMILKNSTSDYFRVKVKDNLTGLDHLSVSIKVWRKI